MSVNKVKVIANYLPQYHTIPENDKWWGKGFTDWIAVKATEPAYEGHNQPRVPLNENYYSLDCADSIRWQASLAREYGIYGFGIYHYWFSSNQQLLQKPAELLLQNKDIDINFMFIWDNLTWKRTWSKLSRGLDWAPNYDKSTEDLENVDSGNKPTVNNNVNTSKLPQTGAVNVLFTLALGGVSITIGGISLKKKNFREIISQKFFFVYFFNLVA